jgi:arginine-glutamic acid dipeptide repeat-containing protein
MDQLLHYQIASGMYVPRDHYSKTSQSDQESQDRRNSMLLRDAVEREMMMLSDQRSYQQQIQQRQQMIDNANLSFSINENNRYGPAAIERARLEQEEREKRDMIEKREREIKEMELKSRMASHAAALSAAASNPFDAQLAELQRRYGAPQFGAPPSVPSASGLPPPFGFLPPGERERLLSASAPSGHPPPHASSNSNNASGSGHSSSSASASASAMAAEQALLEQHRLQTERMMQSNDPIVRLQMANLANELHQHAHTHAHTHAHAHTHLHLHPQDPMAIMGLPNPLEPHASHPLGLHPPPVPVSGASSSLQRPPSVMSRSDPLLPPPGLLRPTFDEQLAHQVSTLFF